MEGVINLGRAGIFDTDNTLAKIWRIVLFKFGITGRNWQKLISAYQLVQADGNSAKGASSIIGNLTGALAKDKISWGTLMRGFDVLKLTHISITLRVGKGKFYEEINIIVKDGESEIMGAEDDD